MYRLFLLGITVMLVFSGCGSQGQPAAGTPQVPAQGAASAAADSPDGAAASTAPAQEAAGPAVPAPSASKPAGSGAKPEPEAAGQAKPKAAEAAKPEASPSAGQAAPAAGAAAPQPSAAAAPEQAQQAPVSAPAPETTGLTISITGDQKHGVILKESTVSYQEGMTVIDALKQVTKQNKIQMETQGKGAYTYVQGIDNLYEFDGGPKSGWVYKVNGRAPGEGAGSYKVAAGDKIEWLYTLDLGEDVGAKMK